MCHIMSQLLDKIKQDSGERACEENKNSELHNKTPDRVKAESAGESRTLNRKDGVNSENHKEVSEEEMTPMEDQSQNNSDIIRKNDYPDDMLGEESSRNIESKDCKCEIQVANDKLQTSEINVNTNSDDIPNVTAENDGQPVRTDDPGSNNDTSQNKHSDKRVLKTNFKEILESFSNKDLQSMLVKNKHGDDVLFCDTGKFVIYINFSFWGIFVLSNSINPNLTDKMKF